MEITDKILDINLFTKCEKIGESEFGLIYKVIRKDNGEICAAKYLQNSNNESQIDFTSSSIESNAEHHHPLNVALFDDQNKNFCSENIENSWICFDFKKHRIIPTEYSIRSRNGIPNWYHPKSWVIECSNDNNSWEIIDEEKNCSFLNGKRMIHTFKIEKQKIKKYRYMRMRSTGPDWFGANYLTMETFEIYGSLI